MKKGILSVICTMTGLTAGVAAAGVTINSVKEKEIGKQKARADKNAVLIDALAKWIELKQDGKSLVPFFKKYGYQTIAIYGMHYIGERLYRELEDSGIEVKYAIDQYRNVTETNVVVKKMDDNLEAVDAVIVTPVFYFNTIEEQLLDKFDCPIVSFDEILEEVAAHKFAEI